MIKQQIIELLLERHKHFTDMIAGLNDADFMHSNNSKWTAGQQLEHIYRSAFPLARVTGDADFKNNAPFGKEYRTSLDYEGVRKAYIKGLGPGFTDIGKFAPGTVELAQKHVIIEKLNNTLQKLDANLNSYTEEDLDTYLLPHPFLGNLTMREMLYLITYHVAHHHRTTLYNLGRIYA